MDLSSTRIIPFLNVDLNLKQEEGSGKVFDSLRFILQTVMESCILSDGNNNFMIWVRGVVVCEMQESVIFLN